jgi:hypothetical protein
MVLALLVLRSTPLSHILVLRGIRPSMATPLSHILVLRGIRPSMAKKKPIPVFGRDGLLILRCSAKSQPATPSLAGSHHQLFAM